MLFGSSMSLRYDYLEKMSRLKFGSLATFELIPQKVQLADNCEKFGKGLSDCLFEISKPQNSTCTWEKYKNFECGFLDQYEISRKISDKISFGYDDILAKTKCRSKCSKDLFSLVEGDINLPTSTFPFTFDKASTILLVQMRPKEKIKLFKKIYKYSMGQDFFS